MKLVFERSQQFDWLYRRWYRLSIEAVLNEVEADVVVEHGLGSIELWCSSVFLSYESEAMSTFERASEIDGWDNASAWQRLGVNRQGLRALRHSYTEGVITVDDLVRGIDFESREVSELMSLEGHLRSTVQTFSQRLEMLCRYENRDVLVVELEPKDTGTVPAKWVTLR